MALGPLGVAEVGAFEAEVAVDAGDGDMGDSSTVIGDFKLKLQPPDFSQKSNEAN